MPTGYTSKVANGEITELKDFAMKCARAFGACVTLRDSNAPIPDVIEPSDFSQRKLKDIKDEITCLKGLTVDETCKIKEKEYKQKMEQYKDDTKENMLLDINYRVLLAKVEKWTPPTDEHVGLKTFMLKQITESIEWNAYVSEPPVRDLSTTQEYIEKRVKTLEESKKYHEKRWQREVERAASNTKWLKDLRDSLEEK